jgi:DsbC/DsbD-like thiol-disulfide interchange protein
MAYPGYFYIEPSGIIREKYFETKYENRFTANNVIAKLFPELAEEVGQSVEAPHLRLRPAQSDSAVAPGSRVTLSVEIELPPGVHVYSPGVKGYKPIQLELEQHSGIEISDAIYPNPQVLYL